MRTTGVLRALASLGVLLNAACGARQSAPGATADAVRGTSNASCVAPYVDDQPAGGPYRPPAPTVHPGDTVTVYGHWYTSTCNDTGRHDPLRPLAPVELTVTWPGGALEVQGPFRPAGGDMGFRSGLRVPSGTPPGTATVRDGRHPVAAYRFHVGS